MDETLRRPGSRALVPVPGTLVDETLRAPSRALVPISGTGDNGYRPNFTRPGDPGVHMDETLRKQRFWSKEASDFRAQQNPVGPQPAPTVATPNPSRASQFVGSADEWRQFAGAAKESLRNTGVMQPSTGITGKVLHGAGKLVGKFAPVAGLVGAGMSAADGDLGGTVMGAADTVAGLGLATPAAPLAGMYLVGRAGAEGGSAIYDRMSRGTQDAIGGTINTALQKVGLGVNDDAMREVNASMTAPTLASARNPNQTAATAARTNVSLRNVSMQGGRGMVNPETVGQTNTRADATERMLAPSTTGKLPRDLAGIEAGKIYKTTDPKTGSTVYSGRDVKDGAPMVNAAGTEIASRGSVSSVPAMNPALVKSTLTNPDGSTWSGQDNAVMAANLRDGVSMYRGTSRQPGEDAAAEQASLRRLALSPLGTPGRTPALKLLTEQAQQETLRRGQDMQLAATLRAAQIKAASDESKALRDQANADRTFRAGRDDAAAALEGRRRDDKRASAKAFSDRVLTMVGTVDGKPDLETAATITNGANAFLANKMVEIEALLKADPKNQKALALKRDIETNGLDSIDEDTMRTLVLGQKANRVARENDGWTINPWAGTAVNTDTPVTSLREQRNMILPNQYITNNGQKIPAGAIEDNPDLRRLIVR